MKNQLADKIINDIKKPTRMKRNKIIDDYRSHIKRQHKIAITFHEAGHAAAIYLNNKARNLPPIFFQIVFKEIEESPNHDLAIMQVIHDDSIASIEGGRLIHTLPYLINVHDDVLMTNQNQAMATPQMDYKTAFETDIINILAGPLAQARYIHQRDNELFNNKLMSYRALKNYGGTSDLKLVSEYIDNFCTTKQEQNEKINELFTTAFDFVTDDSNWKAITKLANYLTESSEDTISYDEVVSVLS